MKKILVAVDGSEPSQRAVRFAADLARRFDASLTLVHVIPPLLVPPDAYGFDVGSMMTDQEKSALELLRAVARGIETPGLRVETACAHGAPGETVADMAEKEGFDMVAVGSRGRNAAARVLLGSVSDRLAHICEKPVLIVR